MKTFKDLFLYILAAIVCMGEIGMIIFMLVIWHKGASTVDAGVVNLIYGLALGYHSAFMIVMGYFFGSSKSSADKNDLLSGKDDRTTTTTDSQSKSVTQPIEGTNNK
jgi:hypothetical protein